MMCACGRVRACVRACVRAWRRFAPAMDAPEDVPAAPYADTQGLLAITRGHNAFRWAGVATAAVTEAMRGVTAARNSFCHNHRQRVTAAALQGHIAAAHHLLATLAAIATAQHWRQHQHRASGEPEGACTQPHQLEGGQDAGVVPAAPAAPMGASTDVASGQAATAAPPAAAGSQLDGHSGRDGIGMCPAGPSPGHRQCPWDATVATALSRGQRALLWAHRQGVAVATP